LSVANRSMAVQYSHELPFGCCTLWWAYQNLEPE
jgi:hypothetical protein